MVTRGDDDGDEEGAGAGTDGAEAGAGAMDTNANDKDAMIVKDAETEAAENTKVNTTVTKSIAMLNATVMASVWSLADRIPRTIVTASVVTMLWRKTKLYKLPAEIEKAISGLLPEVWASSSPTLIFPPSLSVSAYRICLNYCLEEATMDKRSSYL